MPLRIVTDPDDFPALDRAFVDLNTAAGFMNGVSHPPRVLLLYGSLRERSYSRLAVEEAARLLKLLGAEPRIFDPFAKPKISYKSMG
jgi:arsenic resistance protein ArsH